ncbi:MAG: LacI family DNA-binding transcriptional regulator [Armatimonadetes bacterium]|nr:LacI family DNA-binding transcriptional regulator [Armatimonadota bacterium]
MRPQGSPTIRDVARHAGVSVATVSHVLQGKSSLHAAATVERVRRSAEELSYRPNRTAQNLARRRTRTLGVVVETMTTGRFTANAFCVEVLDGILDFAGEADYQVKIVSLKCNDRQTVAQCVDNGSMDAAALIAPNSDGALVAWAQTAALPVALVGSLPDGIDIPRVDVDDEAALHNAVRWLIDLGHRHIGIITGPPAQWSAVRRENAYARAVASAGLEANASLRYAGDYTYASGQAGAAELMTADPRPTAIICGNDGVAVGALEALHRLHIRVPDEVSILGFDDHDVARWCRPQLTTIRQPFHEMGVKAAELLITAIEGGPVLRKEPVIFPGVLVRRRSTAPPPGLSAPRGARRGGTVP